MLKKATHIVLVCMLMELFLGGGGRLTAWGPVSLRMVLFAVAVILTIIHFRKGSYPEPLFQKMLLVFSFMLFAGILTGKINRSDSLLLWEDVKPLLYFFLLPFLSFAIVSRKEILLVNRLIQIAACTMAVVFIFTLILIHSHAITFQDFYDRAFPTGEFFFRGENSFFYKGFIYMCVGILFLHLSNTPYRRFFIPFVFIAILLTFTRGFLLAIGLTYFVYYILLTQSYRNAFASIAICLIVVFSGGAIYSKISQWLSKTSDNTTLLGDRQFSDNERKIQIKQVIAAVTPLSLFVGHGFGNGVEARPVHMEISYLEIFHKQGVLGLLCWAFIILALIKCYKEAALIDIQLSQAFFLGALLIFFQSLTNQYMNNPIGLSMILVSLTSLRVIKKEQ